MEGACPRPVIGPITVLAEIAPAVRAVCTGGPPALGQRCRLIGSIRLLTQSVCTAIPIT